MNCIDKGSIQAFLDQELDQDRHKEIQAHLKSCTSCKILYDEVLANRDETLNLLTQLGIHDEEISIPIYAHPGKKNSFMASILSPSKLKVAAGIALLLATYFATSIFISTRESKADDLAGMALNMMSDLDPNTAWHQNQMVIVITDENGKVTDSFVFSDSKKN